MKKKSVIARAGIMAAALTLATTSMMSGTLARYTTSAEATGKAIVANWEAGITVNGAAVTTDGIELVPVSADASKGITTLSDLTNTAWPSEAMVDKVTGGKAYYLAPGMSGSIPIVIDMGTSNVATHYKIEAVLDETSVALPHNMMIGVAGETLKVGNEKDSMTFTPLTLGEGIIANSDNKTKNKEGGMKATTTLKWVWPLDVTSEDIKNGDVTSTTMLESAGLLSDLYNQWDNDYLKALQKGDGSVAYMTADAFYGADADNNEYQTAKASFATNFGTYGTSNTAKYKAYVPSDQTIAVPSADKTIKMKITITAEQADASQLTT